MNPTVVAACIALAGAVITALFTTLWTTGGRSALLRRAIRQEQEMCRDLPSGATKRELARLIRRRTDLYLARMLPSPEGWRSKSRHRFELISGVVLIALGVLLLVLMLVLPSDIRSGVLTPLANVAAAITGVLVGWHFGRELRRAWSIRQLKRFEWARQFLEETVRKREAGAEGGVGE